ncbi:MAG: GNAT family N-acetyltransferase [Actinomycetales bacterium]
MRAIEPAAEAAWTNALDRNLQFWIESLPRTRFLESPAGPLGYFMWMTDDRDAVLAGIHVLPARRGAGLGGRLLRAFIAEARSAGFSRLTLGVHRDNPARSLYEAAGFRRTHAEGDYLHYALAD